MGRILVLDTETTGFSQTAHRIVEFAAVEVEPRTGLTKAELHRYVNPLQPIPVKSTQIHGLRDEDVKGEPSFRALVEEISDFMRGATLAIHNASFDTRMLDAELERSGAPNLAEIASEIVDTLEVSRNLFPLRAHHDLNTVCDAFGISLQHRGTHSALVDVKLLASTLPCFAREYDAWRGVEESGCASELDAFETDLHAFIGEALATVNTSTPEYCESSACRLAGVDRWLSSASKWFDSTLDEIVRTGDTWSCKHYAAIWETNTSMSWKDMALANLSTIDLESYKKQIDITTYTPKPDGDVVARAESMRGLYEQDAVARSVAALLRGISVLRSVGKQVGKARGNVREGMMRYIDEGYVLQAGALRSGSQNRVNYNQAVEDLCPDADQSPYQAESISRKVTKRETRECALLFG